MLRPVEEAVDVLEDVVLPDEPACVRVREEVAEEVFLLTEEAGALLEEAASVFLTGVSIEVMSTERTLAEFPERMLEATREERGTPEDARSSETGVIFLTLDDLLSFSIIITCLIVISKLMLPEQPAGGALTWHYRIWLVHKLSIVYHL